MTTSKVTGAIIITGLLLIGVTAVAMGPGHGRGSGMMGSGYDQGSGMMGQGMMGQGMMGRGFTDRGMTGPGDGSWWDNLRPNAMSNEETARLRSEIFQRRAQLRDLLAEDEVDIAQVKAVQGEINRLEREMAERRSNMNGSGGSGWLPRLLNRWR